MSMARPVMFDGTVTMVELLPLVKRSLSPKGNEKDVPVKSAAARMVDEGDAEGVAVGEFVRKYETLIGSCHDAATDAGVSVL